VPQGSVLGPLLLVIYVSDLSLLINVPHALFADDTKLYANPNLQSTTSLLENNLGRISQWCESWLLTLNIDKYKVLLRPKGACHKQNFSCPDRGAEWERKTQKCGDNITFIGPCTRLARFRHLAGCGTMEYRSLLARKF
jgi:hypothetical protein